MQEKELIRLIQKDPNEGYAQLMRRYGALAAAVARNLLLSAGLAGADVEDCLADSLIELAEKLPAADPDRGSLKALFCTITRHNALDRIRRQRQEIPLEEIGDVPDEYSLEERFAEKDLRERLYEAVRGLKEPEREIILRKYYLGQSTKEIAERLGFSPGNVDVKAHRAVQILRGIMGEK